MLSSATPFLTLPYSLQLIVVALSGAVLGVFVNWAVDRFAWTPRFRSPWRRLPPNVSGVFKRRSLDFVPIVGWFSAIRWNRSLFPANDPNKSNAETKLDSESRRKLEIPGLESHWFWVRPLLIELGLAIFLVWFYWTKTFLYFDSNCSLSMAATDLVRPNLALIHFMIQTFLIVLMLIASLIDFDDYIIPDVVIIPGTVLGVLLTTLCCQSELCFNYPARAIDLFPFFCGDGSGWMKPTTPFWILTACWTFWTFALLDRRWYSKLPLKKRLLIFGRSLKRSALTPILTVLWILGILFFYRVCSPSWNLDDVWRSPEFVASVSTDDRTTELISEMIVERLGSQTALFQAILGATVGMILIWLVRIAGRLILNREAMGFGDVTLLGMIGVFVGWRGAVVVFFLAPFAGLIFGLIRMLFRSEREIPYGPFLCLATLPVLMESSFVDATLPLFEDPVLFWTLAGTSAVLFVVLLAALQAIKRFIFH